MVSLMLIRFICIYLILHAAVEQCLDPGEHRGQIRGAARSRAACGQGPKPLAGAIGQMA